MPNNRVEDYKQYGRETGYLPLKKPSSSKSPVQAPLKKQTTQPSNTKLDAPVFQQLPLKTQPSGPLQQSFNNTQKLSAYTNFSALIQNIKQKEHSKEREVTPRSFKGGDTRPADPKKPKTIGVKFREYMK